MIISYELSFSLFVEKMEVDELATKNTTEGEKESGEKVSVNEAKKNVVENRE